MKLNELTKKELVELLFKSLRFVNNYDYYHILAELEEHRQKKG